MDLPNKYDAKDRAGIIIRRHQGNAKQQRRRLIKFAILRDKPALPKPLKRWLVLHDYPVKQFIEISQDYFNKNQIEQMMNFPIGKEFGYHKSQFATEWFPNINACFTIEYTRNDKHKFPSSSDLHWFCRRKRQSIDQAIQKKAEESLSVMIGNAIKEQFKTSRKEKHFINSLSFIKGAKNGTEHDGQREDQGNQPGNFRTITKGRSIEIPANS